MMSDEIEPTKITSTTHDRSLFDHTPESMALAIEAWGQPKYRASQVLKWAYSGEADSYDQMSNLPKSLRQRLVAEMPLYESTIVAQQHSTDDTTKLLLRWSDGALSECVLIPDGTRRTACISSQVGCPVRCVFCASGLGGLERQLTKGQIVEQVMRIRQACAGARLSNVVFMGLGEPLANYDAVVGAVRTIMGDWGVGIGARKITVSTVGLPKQIKRLADEKMQITLAISLHAPEDELRKRIIPWAERVDIDSLVDAAKYYFDQTGREVTLEYILLGKLNDSQKHARDLSTVAKRMRSNVNLIPYNPVSGLEYERPTDEDASQFLNVLMRRGINAHIRRSRGLDIDAACGQLRKRAEQ